MTFEELLRRPEGKRLEYKRDLSSPQPVLRALVAFANSAGGVLVLGVDDDHSVRGLADPIAVEHRLINLISDSIAPRLVPEVDIVRWRSTNVIVVTVHLSPSRPHRLVADGSVYVRMGASNRTADPQLVEEMRRSSQFESFDETAYPSASLAEIDFEEMVTEFAPRRKVRRADLAVLGLSVQDQGREVPTVGGLVLFGRDRTALPDATIRCARFDGVTRARIVDSIDLVGPSMPAMVRHAMAFVDSHFARRVVINGLTNEIERPVPLTAVREALVNAVVHADYSQRGGPIRVALFSDRLEIENPGLLPFGVAVEDLSSGISRVRNKVIARTFKELGFIEQWGSGIGKINDEVKAAGLAPPTFEEIGGRFRVTFSMLPVAHAVLSPDHQAMLAAVRSAGSAGMSTSQLTTAIGKSARTARSRMSELVTLGLVFEVGSSPTDPHRRYIATSDGNYDN